MEKILSGKPVALSINEKTKSLIQQESLKPVMSIIRVGIDPASEYYVQNIIKQGNKLGCDFLMHSLDENVPVSEILNIIEQNNADDSIHGIMIQKPLPKSIDENIVNNTVEVRKDIDGVNPMNLGKLFLDQTSFVPCTAAAVIELIKYYGIAINGKHVVILGRSSVVGIPLIGLLLQKHDFGNATVTVCHSKTPDIKSITLQADVIISAIGKPLFVTGDMIKLDAICIDVGINLVKDMNGRDIYVGDFEYNSCFDKAGAITPVPGGIGTITTSILLNNIVKATITQSRHEKLLT